MVGELDKQALLALSMDTLTFISSAARSLNQLRREMTKGHLDRRFQQLCSRTERPEEGPLLFGAELMRAVKAKQEETHLGRRRVFRTRGVARRPLHRMNPYGRQPYRRGVPRRRVVPGIQTLLRESPICETSPDSLHVTLDNRGSSNYNVVALLPSSTEDTTNETREALVQHGEEHLEQPACSQDPLLPLVRIFDNEFVQKLQIILDTPFKGGALQNALEEWKRITKDFIILKTVQGMDIEFLELPSNLRTKHQIRFSPHEHAVVQQEIRTLLDKEVIEPVDHCDGEVISNIFTRQKRDSGKYRVILNLSELNEYIVYHHFKMDTLQTALAMITPGCFCATIDLADAYYSVSMDVSVRKYLRFQYDGVLYQFCCLPNGLSPGPREFTKLLKPPLAVLRKSHGISIMGYLDDLLISGSTFAEVKSAVELTVDLFTRLGFHISVTKSQFCPASSIEFLGFHIDTISMRVHMLDKKADRLKADCLQLQKSNIIPIRVLAQLLGQMAATLPANPFGKLYMKTLEVGKIQALRDNCGNYDASMVVTSDLTADLPWWIDNVHALTRRIVPTDPDITIFTDASLAGWGCHIPATKETTSGRWSILEQTFHINVLELLAMQYSLQSLLHDKLNVHIRVMTDNTVTKLCINNQGSTASMSCNKVTRAIWDWCIERTLWLSAAHCPGKLNVEADLASRKFHDDTEWSLHPELFSQICEQFGTPTIDMFASRLNAKLDRFVSWLPDLNAFAVDAFSMTWTFHYLYAFPPFSLLPGVIQKLRMDGASAILVVPCWPTQAWFPGLLRILAAPPLAIPVTEQVLRLVHNRNKLYPLTNKLTLWVCRCSSNHMLIEEFQRQLWVQSSPVGGKVPWYNTRFLSENGLRIAMNGVLTPLKQLLLRD